MVLRGDYSNISDKVFKAVDVDKVHFNRTNENYQPILNWCRLFLSSMSPDVTAGKQELFSILFDMNMLFERWVAAELKPIARSHGLTLKTQQPRRFLGYRPDIDRHVFQTQPDITLYDMNQKLVCILDAKWKTLESTEIRLGISQPDVYQLTSYGYLYGVKYLSLIYPMQNSLNSSYSIELRGEKPLLLDVKCVDILSGLEPTIIDSTCEKIALDTSSTL